MAAQHLARISAVCSKELLSTGTCIHALHQHGIVPDLEIPHGNPACKQPGVKCCNSHAEHEAIQLCQQNFNMTSTPALRQGRGVVRLVSFISYATDMLRSI